MFSGKPNPFVQAKSGYKSNADYFYDNIAASKVRDEHMKNYTETYKHVTNPESSSEELSNTLGDLGSGKYSEADQHELHKVILSHPNVDISHVRAAIDHSNDGVAIHAINHPSTTPETLLYVLGKSSTGQSPSELFDQKYYKQRMAAASHPNANKEVLDMALKDSHNHVFHSAMNNPNRTQ
jgi:hypothetical protein